VRCITAHLHTKLRFFAHGGNRVRRKIYQISPMAGDRFRCTGACARRGQACKAFGLRRRPKLRGDGRRPIPPGLLPGDEDGPHRRGRRAARGREPRPAWLHHRRANPLWADGGRWRTRGCLPRDAAAGHHAILHGPGRPWAFTRP
jgi:hypothetical protein